MSVHKSKSDQYQYYDSPGRLIIGGDVEGDCIQDLTEDLTEARDLQT